jgi:malate synthase
VAVDQRGDVSIDVAPAPRAELADVAAGDALAFAVDLHREFDGARQGLLAARVARHAALAAGERPSFLESTRSLREGSWTISPVPAALADRRVEITGPTERKMLINAMNSGARVFMADFEDATSPTWENILAGQVNLTEAIAGTISLSTEDKTYTLRPDTATLIVRPRGWHLPERHVVVDGAPLSGSLFDFGLFVARNAAALASSGRGPFFYLPKMESHLEARLWNDVFVFAEERYGLARGTIRATVLIEHILAAFEMDEILYELRDHAAGLNAGRWDYIFSAIKCFPDDPGSILPDRAQVTMTVPFMRAYTELLISTCHRRGAHAIGGMAAFIPSRRDPEVNEVAMARVREDKTREAADGCDGSWVAHPDLVPVVMEIFDDALRASPNQLARLRDDVSVSGSELLNFSVPDGSVTPEGVVSNVAVALRYLSAWLGGLGAVAIFNLMEDAATAEISRSQIWQWIRHGRVDRADVERAISSELAELAGTPHLDEAEALLRQVALGPELPEFLTLPAYELL